MNSPATPLLDIRDLRTWFPIRRGVFSRTTGHVRAVDRVSLDVGRAETVGLVGESGCGKSTLARTVIGLDEAAGGSIRFDGHELLGRPRRELRPLQRRIQMVFQDPYSSLNPRLTVVDLVTEGMIAHRLLRARDREREALRLLNEVGLDAAALHRYPHEFSGGQRQRICIARALALQPDFVICDEAVSALDVSIRAQILNLLMDLRDRHRLAYLFISHDLGVVRHIAQRVAVMYLGRLVDCGSTAAVLDQPLHPYTRALIAAMPVPHREKRRRLILAGDVPSAARPPPGCRFHPRCPFALDVCRQVEPALEPPPGDPDPRHRVACHRKHELPPPA
jgi:oligopeptide/dipeptide ABC transporter ATP-binding protein